MRPAIPLLTVACTQVETAPVDVVETDDLSVDEIVLQGTIASNGGRLQLAVQPGYDGHLVRVSDGDAVVYGNPLVPAVNVEGTWVGQQTTTRHHVVLGFDDDGEQWVHDVWLDEPFHVDVPVLASRSEPIHIGWSTDQLVRVQVTGCGIELVEQVGLGYEIHPADLPNLPLPCPLEVHLSSERVVVHNVPPLLDLVVRQERTVTVETTP